MREAGKPERSGADGDRFLHDLAEECNLCRARAVENTSVRPPQDAILREIGLAVAAICALRRRLPEAPRHLVAAQISPHVGNVAFVLAFVKNTRLLPVRTPARGLLHA